MSRIRTMDDWVDYFHAWLDDIGMTSADVRDYRFQALYGDLPTDEIIHGDFKGQKRWERVMEVPDQRVRDALLNLIVYQGDTEFASVEQQRFLFDTAPNDYDLKCLVRVMTEEIRHGYQMCDVLLRHFGDSGRVEAQKLLERRAFKNTRLLGSFNVNVDNWVDFFVYTQFVDRDGKFQLKMLSYSSFAPLARSMGPMLKEESFHLGTGNNGLRRIVQAGKIPIPLLQKFFNKWIPTAYDLFGNDESSSAHWAYVWGLKGRFDEDVNPSPADRAHLNETSRGLYYEEVGGLVDALNRLIPDGQPRLYRPDLRFHRAIGKHVGESWSVFGDRLSDEDHARHLAEVLPSTEDVAQLTALTRSGDWIASR
jgi:benzoyl-CoA 2,3-dioxygenase component B